MIAEPERITSLQAPPPGWEWSPDARERVRRARASDPLFHLARTDHPETLPSPEAAPTPTRSPQPHAGPRETRPDAWTPEQDALLWEWAGLEPPERLAARCSGIGPARTAASVRQRAVGLRISLRKRQRRNYERSGWQPEEDAVLRDLAGSVPVAEITERLNERFGTRRRLSGVQHRAGQLGVSMLVEGLIPAHEVRTILRIGWAEMTRLLRSRELPVARRSPGQGGDWGIEPDALAAYIRQHPERVRWQEMPAGRWRDTARAASLRAPYLSLREAAAAAGTSRAAFSRMLLAGRIAGAVRYRDRWRIPLRSATSTDLGRVSRLARGLAALPLLSEEWQTSDALAPHLGVSAGVIRAGLQAARRVGHPIESHAGLGYRLRSTRRVQRGASHAS